MTGLLVLAACAALVVVWVNRNRHAQSGPAELSEQPQLAELEGRELTVSTWNLGYAGLGVDSDFLVDGGTMKRAPSRQSAQRNLEGILAQVQELDVDVAIFQEVGAAGFMNRFVPLKKRLLQHLADRQLWFRASSATWGFPPPLSIHVGELVASSKDIDSAFLEALPEEPEPMAGILNRRYGLQVVRLSGASRWTVINLHLSAFDGGGHLRRAQLERVFEVAQAEHQAGRHVVVGGDWNLELVDTDFPHQTPSEHLFWLEDFPTDMLPEGWQIAVDPTLATVRTNHQPYVAGENYTAIIDGFIVSPNVEIIEVRGVDTGFLPSDHMPVMARFGQR